LFIFFFQAEDGIRDRNVTGVQTCALPISVIKQHGGATLLFDRSDNGGRVAAEAELEIDPDGCGQPYDQGAQTHEQTEVAPINVEAAVEDLAELHRSQIRGAQILRNNRLPARVTVAG